MNIELEKTSDATQIKCGTVYNYGTLKVGDHEYPFTIEEMVNDNPRWTESEITWAEDTPPDHEEAEEAIMLKFEQLGAPALEEQVNDKMKAAADALRNMAQPSRNTDARQLTAHIDGDHEGRIEQDGWGITIRVDHAEDPEMIRELTRRWNAYNAMLAAFEKISQHAYDEDTSDEAIRDDFDNMRKIALTAIEQATK